MKKYLGLCLLAMAFNANAALMYSASFTPQLCGPYPYKTSLGFSNNLPIFKQSAVSHGFTIWEEEGRLATFIRGWMDFFTNNGDRKLWLKSVCYGFFDDENSTGPNALAYGDKAILIGTKMMKIIRDDIDSFVAQTYDQYNPDQKMVIKCLKSTAALDFLLLHEFSHFLQNVHGYKFSGTNAKMMELHADCVGASLFTLGKVHNNIWTSQDALAGLMYAYALGDSNVTSSDHHGYPDERQVAFSQGMSTIINWKNSFVDLSKLTSKSIMDACSAYYK